MDLVLQIQEMVNYLDEAGQKEVLQLIENLLPEPDDEGLTEDVLYYLKLAEEEFARGETIRHSDIDWD